MTQEPAKKFETRCPLCGGTGLTNVLDWMDHIFDSMGEDTKKTVLGYLIGRHVEPRRGTED